MIRKSYFLREAGNERQSARGILAERIINDCMSRVMSREEIGRGKEKKIRGNVSQGFKDRFCHVHDNPR